MYVPPVSCLCTTVAAQSKLSALYTKIQTFVNLKAQNIQHLNFCTVLCLPNVNVQIKIRYCIVTSIKRTVLPHCGCTTDVCTQALTVQEYKAFIHCMTHQNLGLASQCFENLRGYESLGIQIRGRGTDRNVCGICIYSISQEHLLFFTIMNPGSFRVA